MKYPIVTFAVCAYNEEKLIKNCINHIRNLDYPNKEIIVGSDGNDGTSTIAKAMGVKVIIANERIGQTEMLMRIMKEAKGEIIIINDVEFLLFPNYVLYDVAKVFSNKKIGGLSFGTSMMAENDYATWWKFVESIIQNIFAYYKCSRSPVKSLKEANFVVISNAFRKSMVGELTTLNDDAEISYQLLAKKKYVVYAPHISFYSPGGAASNMGDNIKQKTRTSIGWTQLSKKYNLNFSKFYLESCWLFMKLIFSLLIWIGMYAFSFFKGKILYIFGKQSAKQVWNKFKRDV